MTQDERKLIAALRSGDPEAQVQLHKQYGEPLVGFLVAVCGVDQATAEDIGIEALYRAVEKIDSFREIQGSGQHAFRNWLFSIARNRWRDWKREHGRLVQVGDWDSAPAPVADKANRVTDTVAEAVQEALKQLPPAQRVTIEMHYGGQELTEIARLLKVDAGTVRQWKKRGLAKLANLLGNDPRIASVLRTKDGIQGVK